MRMNWAKMGKTIFFVWFQSDAALSNLSVSFKGAKKFNEIKYVLEFLHVGIDFPK